MTTTLPTLTGSEKQIAWATEIREAALPAMRQVVAGYVAQSEAVRPVCDAWIARLESEADAGWWIDNRDLSNGAFDLRPVFRTFLAEVKQVARAAR